MNELSQRAWFLFEYLDLPAATGDPSARWEPFQIAHLNNQSVFGLARKTRQGGESWLFAAEALAAACIEPRSTHTFVSLNLKEASEKIRYAKQCREALDREVRPKLLTDNRFEIELANGSRLISHPCTPPRGKPSNVYLDEFAHYPRAEEVYEGAVPMISRVPNARLRIGSTVLGAGGLFWEIATQKIRQYPGYTRQFIPWWFVQGLCRNVAEAVKLAPHLLTEQRVQMFGTPRLLQIFENLPLDSFQQEYECRFTDESTAWISWADIRRNQLDAQAGRLWCKQAVGVDEALAAIDEVAQAVRDGVIEPVLVAGYDVGRKKDLSELIFLGKGISEQRPYRLGISLANTAFDDQCAVASKALEVLPVTKMLVDRNGLGMQLAEQLNYKFGTRAEGATFTNATKELWAVGLKVAMQRGRVPLPLDKDLVYQIHSIKKKVSMSNNTIFDTAGNEKHHADKFWSLALAHMAGSPAMGGVGL